jgi:hypothetical protein
MRNPGFGMGVLYGVRYSDMCAFRAIRRDALCRLDMREMTYGWNIEMQMKAARAKLRIHEVPLQYRCRVGGESKVAGSCPGRCGRAARSLPHSCESDFRQSDANPTGLPGDWECGRRSDDFTSVLRSALIRRRQKRHTEAVQPQRSQSLRGSIFGSLDCVDPGERLGSSFLNSIAAAWSRWKWWMAALVHEYGSGCISPSVSRHRRFDEAPPAISTSTLPSDAAVFA